MEDTGDNSANHQPSNGTSPVVGKKARNRGEDDTGHGSAQRDVHEVFMRQVLTRKTENQHGDNDQTTADAQQTGKDPGDCTHSEIDEDDFKQTMLLGTLKHMREMVREERRIGSADIRPAPLTALQEMLSGKGLMPDGGRCVTP